MTLPDEPLDRNLVTAIRAALAWIDERDAALQAALAEVLAHPERPDRARTLEAALAVHRASEVPLQNLLYLLMAESDSAHG